MQTQAEATAWYQRGAVWDRSAFGFQRGAPLVLGGHGAHIAVHRGSLLARDGYTRYPQQRGEHRLWPASPDKPSAVVLVDADGLLSVDALQWLADQFIPLIILNWRGEVTVATGDVPADPDVWLAQAHACAARPLFALAPRLLAEKFLACLATLKQLPVTSVVTRAVEMQWTAIGELSDAGDVRDLFLIEAGAAGAYFAAMQSIELAWKGTRRQPIPSEWRTVGARVAWGGTNRHAFHPFNALLNYGYGLLEGRVTAVTRLSGLHPAFGVLHARGKGRPSLTLDLMEPLRAVVDQVVLDLVRSRTFSRDDFELTSAGLCRVRPELARVVVRAVDTATRCEPVVAVAREAFLAGGCDVEPSEFAPALVHQLDMPTRTVRPATTIDYSSSRQRSVTAPQLEALSPIGRGRLGDRPPMPPNFVARFQELLGERGITRSRLSVLCDFHANYWQQVLGNTRRAPSREALLRAATHLRLRPQLLLELAGYGRDPGGV